MKQLFYFLSLFMLTISTYAQTQNSSSGKLKFDLAIDALQFVERGGIVLDFDYNLKSHSALTFNASIFGGNNLFTRNSNYQTPPEAIQRFKVGIGYKMYFSQKDHSGLYTTVGLNFQNGDVYRQAYTYIEDFNNINVFFRIGYKYVNANNFYIDAFIEAANPIIGENYFRYSKPGMYMDYGIKIGKRF